MNVLTTHILRGGNRWATVPVFEVELELGPDDTKDLRSLPSFVAGLTGLVPSAMRLTQECGPVHSVKVLLHLALQFQRFAGSPVQFGMMSPMAEPRRCRLVFEFEEERLAHSCFRLAQDFCRSPLDGVPVDAAKRLAELRELAHDVRLGPSSMGIVRAALTRNIPYRRLSADSSLVVLGQGARQRRVCTAETDATSAIAESIAQDKELTRSLLRSVGVPVPAGRPVSDAEDAWLAAQQLGLPVVVKPQHGNHGRGVATNLRTRDQVEKAYAAALAESCNIMVEQFVEGVDHRLLVIGGRLIAAALREPAQVVGDGTMSIRELVEDVNRDPRRSDGHATALSFIKLDAIALEVLADQGFTPDSIPRVSQKVLIRRNGNLSTGGTASDVTDEVHPDVAVRAVDAARVVGLDIAGVDIVARDLRLPLEEQRGAIVEVNAGPGLRMHMEPSAGMPRPVGDAIISMLFPAGNGRIPVTAVAASGGSAATTRVLAHLLRAGGYCVGMTCCDETYVDGRRIEAGDCMGFRSARAVLLNPLVTAAVLETSRESVIHDGLGFDRCDAAIVTNIAGAHSRGSPSAPEDVADIERVIVESVAPGGVAVLNADDPLTTAMAAHCPGSVIFFTDDCRNPIVTVHRAKGRKAVLIQDGTVIIADGRSETPVQSLDAGPLTQGGERYDTLGSVLAAVAAGFGLELPKETIQSGLATLDGAEANWVARQTRQNL